MRQGQPILGEAAPRRFAAVVNRGVWDGVAIEAGEGGAGGGNVLDPRKSYKPSLYWQAEHHRRAAGPRRFSSERRTMRECAFHVPKRVHRPPSRR